MLTQLIAILMAVTMHSAQMQVEFDATYDRYSDAVQECNVLQARYDELEMENESLRAELSTVESVECGTCGAHVTEWWYLAPYNPDGTIDVYGEPVAVCKYCYEGALD